MGCCKSCDAGGPCDCGGNCNGSCGDAGNYQYFTAAQMHDSDIESNAYDAVMGGPLADDIRQNTKLWKKGDFLYVKYRNPNWRGSIVVSVPFAPLMIFCQNLAMLYGRPETRSTTVSGYAPILALVTSQLASKKIADDTDKKDKAEGKKPAPNIADFGPVDLTSLLKMLPLAMVGVEFVKGDNVIMGACGCGVNCDGIQPNSPYMNPRRVVRRAQPWTAWNVARSNAFWNKAPRINDQGSNNFGRAYSAPPSATPPSGWPNRQVDSMAPSQHKPEDYEVSGWTHQTSHRSTSIHGEVPCSNGGTCGKGCCG